MSITTYKTSRRNTQEQITFLVCHVFFRDTEPAGKGSRSNGIHHNNIKINNNNNNNNKENFKHTGIMVSPDKYIRVFGFNSPLSDCLL
jgi:hypothetical protein